MQNRAINMRSINLVVEFMNLPRMNIVLIKAISNFLFNGSHHYFHMILMPANTQFANQPHAVLIERKGERDKKNAKSQLEDQEWWTDFFRCPPYHCAGENIRILLFYAKLNGLPQANFFHYYTSLCIWIVKCCVLYIEQRLACSKCKQKPNLCDLLSCRHRYLGSSCTLCISILFVVVVFPLPSRWWAAHFQCIIMFVGVWTRGRERGGGKTHKTAYSIWKINIIRID